MAEKDLTPLPNRGTGPLTEEELARIRYMTDYDAVTLACGLIGHARAVLACPANDHNAAARSVGFENAEHDVLAFLASEWFETLVTGVLGASRVPHERTPLEYAQDLVDVALGPDVLEVVPVADGGEIVKRDGRRPRGRGYVGRLTQEAAPGTCVLEEYSQAILAEQVQPDVLILELPGLTLAVEETSGAEVRRA